MSAPYDLEQDSEQNFPQDLEQQHINPLSGIADYGLELSDTEPMDEDWLDEQEPSLEQHGDESNTSGASHSQDHQALMSMRVGSATNFETMYHFVGLFYVRDFRTEHMTDAAVTKDVYGDSAEDILKSIWDTAEEFVKREVIVKFVDGDFSVCFANPDKPTQQDMGRFVFFKSEKGKRLLTTEDITSRISTNWRGKQIPIHIFRYSGALTTKSVYDTVKKTLLKPNERVDRSGAPTTEELFEVAGQLKQMHPHYSSVMSAWEKWANYVLCHPQESRSKLMSEAPPDEYIHLFRSVPTAEGHTLRDTRYGLSVARNILERQTANVDRLYCLLEEAFTNISALRDEAIQMRSQLASSSELLDAMERSLPPVEGEFSRSLSQRISNVEDIDHQ